MSRPTIAITMGDPAGIGPEVIMKALALPGTQAI
jgi:4-hydroxy-L-threonine phosphate dehydrogenase PdxA